MPRYEDLLELFRENGQEHVFGSWEKLFLDQQEELLKDCAQVDFAWLKARWDELMTVQAFGIQGADDLSPPDVARLPSLERDIRRSNEAREVGEETLRQGKVAALLAAGGQASRLGYNGPKGCFPIGPLSNRSLFQWYAEQVLASARRYGVTIPLYIMTSSANEREIRQFFEENEYFGLRLRDVVFFRQAMVPSLDLGGKLMLATPSTLVMNPNGHGGALLGLKKSGVLHDMRNRGIEYISYFQVDNPLVTAVDPLFVGWHVRSAAEMSCKVVEKKSPSERIGAACIRKGFPTIVEYSELTDEEARATDYEGKLKLWAGSIGVHLFNTDFAERIADEGRLRWHQSRRKVSYFSSNRLIKPEKENSVRFETFIFDALRDAKKAFNLEVRREEEFAPLKNAEGSDSIDSCRLLLSNHFCDWLARSGVSVPVPGMGGAAVVRPTVEISPLYALDADELRAKISPEGLKLEKFLLLG